MTNKLDSETKTVIFSTGSNQYAKKKQLVTISEHVCRYCKQTKPISAFIRSKGRAAGYEWLCKECSKIVNHSSLRSERDRLLRKISNSRDPQKSRARMLARRARQRLIKERCEECGSMDNLQLHHEDYSKPYEVVTLCAGCHAKTTYKEEPKYTQSEFDSAIARAREEDIRKIKVVSEKKWKLMNKYKLKITNAYYRGSYSTTVEILDKLKEESK